jgi:hypothetical protein
MIAPKSGIRACSACAGDYEDPERAAEDPELDGDACAYDELAHDGANGQDVPGRVPVREQ